ncbi:unnamed protein product [Peronospora effusa]|nr:unnamed protein product [Peronospora effusa]
MKISGLRYTDVCGKARRLFESERDHDHVVSFLIGALLPLMNIRSVSKALIFFEMVLHSLGQSPKCSDEDTTLFLLTTLYYVIDFLDGLAVSKDAYFRGKLAR